jgi:hypothetical protein
MKGICTSFIYFDFMDFQAVLAFLRVGGNLIGPDHYFALVHS